jgi:hypothetical protein
MTYEVQTYDATDKTVYYETVRDAMSYKNARDVIAVQVSLQDDGRTIKVFLCSPY